MIYAVQPTAGGPVKIGYSADVPTRVAQLEAHYGLPLAVLATMPGGRDEEQAIHRRFAHLRFGRTEQFRPAADLMAFLGRPLLVGANPATVEAVSLPPKPAPSKGVETSSIKIETDVRDLARRAGFLRGETIVEYISRTVREVAEGELLADARKQIAEAEARSKRKVGDE